LVAGRGRSCGQGRGMVSDGSSDDDDGNVQLQYKVVVLGDGAVGKTSICHRFTDDNFEKSYKQTVGLDFFIKQVVLDSMTVSLQIWDIGGQSIGSQMIKNYIFGAHAVLLVFDITNFESFQNLEDWLALVKSTFNNANLPILVLVANKRKPRYSDDGEDLIHLRVVKSRAQSTFAESNNMTVFEVSAKSGDQVSTCFTKVAADLAGIKLSRHQLETATKIVQAEIVNYQQNDPDEKPIVLEQAKGKCAIQ
ncbi:hypothetical protein PBRA_000798, partial [Plasmodiophora brassicae]